MSELDAALAERGAIVVTQDNLHTLEAAYKESAPEFFHALEEFHHLMYEKFEGELPGVVGYLVISQHQPDTKRVQLVLTWNKPELDEDRQIVYEDGEPKLALDEHGNRIRMTSGATTYIHKESEWHEH